MTRTFSLKDVAEHSTKEAPWTIIHGKVYDLTKFVPQHPGGETILFREAVGKDATEAFEQKGHSDRAKKWLKDFEIGTLGDQPKKWYHCALYQGIAVAVGIVGLAAIIGIAVTKAKH